MTGGDGSAGISTSTDGRWAPFPVQDWSAMPRLGHAHSPVDPTWGPPRSRRRWGWVPGVAIGLVLVLLAGCLLVADRLGAAPITASAQRYVPDDGAVGYALSDAAGGGPEPVVVESARYVSGEITSALDFTLSARVLGALHGDYLGREFWRTTTTEATGTDRSQQVRLYALGEDVTLIAESWPGRGLVFDPGLVELPADVAAGRRWSSSGSAGPDTTYRTAYRAEPAPDGCLRVVGELRLATKDGTPRSTRAQDRTWCPGRGVVASTESVDGITAAASAVAEIDAPQVATTREPTAWSAPAAWRTSQFRAVSVDPTFGEQAMTGVPTSVAPAVTTSGLLFRAVTGAEDVAAFGPYTAVTWRSLRRMHPGGQVLSVTAFGNVVVAATSQRQLVGYSDQGVRLWSVGLDDIAAAEPVRLSGDTVAVVDLAGTIRSVALVDGTVRWTASGADVARPPVLAAGVLVVGDRSGTVTAYDPGDGEQRWQLDVDLFAGAAGAGDTVVLVADQTIQGVGGDEGDRRWMRPYRGTFQSVSAVGPMAVVNGRAGSVLVSAQGTTTALAAYQKVSPGDGMFVGWGKDRADVLDLRGTVLASRPIPALTVVSEHLVAAESSGVLLMGVTTWQIDRWGAR